MRASQTIVTDILRDFALALRGLRKAPGFAAAALATLAIGIGVNAAVFTLTKAVLFGGFPAIDGNDRIAYVASRRGACCLSYPDFEDWRAQTRSFEDLAVVHGVGVSFSDSSGLPESRDATEVSANTFEVVGLRPAMGRDFDAADAAPGAAPVVIISHGFWQRRYAADPSIVGRVVRINGEPATVIGVMPEGFAFPQKQDLWLPLVPTPDLLRRDNRSLWFAFGRLAPGATFESVQTELDAIGRRLAAEYPDTNRDDFPQARTFNEFFIGANENLLYRSMWGAVGFVLLIACANLANLLLARGLSRTREIAVRAALGAGFWRIVRQLLAESVTLSALGGVLGWWIAKGIVHLYSLAERGPGLLPWRVLDYTMDDRVLVYLAAIALGTGLVFGIVPALKLARLDANAGLKDGQRGALGGRRAKRLSGVLVGAEVALAVVLLAGAGLMVRSYLNVAWTDPGVATSNVLTALVQLPPARYPDGQARTALFESLETRLDALPGVDSVAFASALPTWGAQPATYELRESSEIDAAQRPTTFAITVSPKYFATLGVPLLAGRELTATDGTNAPPVAIVNRAFANREWPGEDPIGKRLRLYDGANPKAWLTVVGIAGNVAQTDATRQAFDPLVYLSYRQEPPAALWAIVKSRERAAALGTSLRLELQRLDASLAFWLGPFTLEERIAEGYWDKQLYGILFVSFAAIALLLAALGLYAIVAYSVNANRREIGIRVAVGATARDVVGRVIKQSLAPVAIGLLAGIAGALALTRVLESELVHVSATDPMAYAAACLVLSMAAALGAWLPARRATRVDPVIALRED